MQYQEGAATWNEGNLARASHFEKQLKKTYQCVGSKTCNTWQIWQGIVSFLFFESPGLLIKLADFF